MVIILSLKPTVVETFLEKYHCHYDRMVNKLQSVESKDSWTALTISKIPESW